MTLSPSPTEAGRFARWGSALPGILGQATLWALLWLGLINFPTPPSAGLDPSWRQVLGYAVSHQLQHGADIVFTYGPLGYLLPATNSGAQHVHHLVWQLGVNALFATVIWLYGRTLRGWRQVLYYVYFLSLGLGFGDTVHTTMILLLGLALLREPVAARRWLAGLAAVLLGVLALVKFTNFMLACFAIACVCGHHAWRRRWFDLALAAVPFVATFLLGWVLWDQHLGNIPAYVINSFNAAMGYGEGMCIYEDTPLFVAGLGGALCLGLYYVATLWKRNDPVRAWAVMLIAAATSFINWKHGYIRADGHVFAHYITSLLLVVAGPVLLMDDGPWQRLKGGLLVLTAGFCLAGCMIIGSVSITDAPAIWNYHTKGVVNQLRIIGDFRRNAKVQYWDTARANAIPSLKQRIGDDSIDVLGHEQSYILFTGLNYTPRPVFQSYFSYTERLLRLNDAFYRSDKAPKYVAQRLDSIDYRLPALDDSLALLRIYQQYTFLGNESNFLLWRKNPKVDPAQDESVALGEVTAAFGQTVPVPAHDNDAIWAEVEVRPSLLGKLRGFLYKAPILTLKVTDNADIPTDYRIIREMARTGFLAYPHFTTTASIEQYQRGGTPARIKSLSVELPEAERKYFQRDIAIRFRRLKPLPQTATPDAPEIRAQIFRMLDRVPDAATALVPVGPLLEEGELVLGVHPPSAVEYNVTFPATRLRGRYGISSTAYQAPNSTDGVEFIIDWLTADGRTTRLFTRYLQPVSVAADRGFQELDLPLPAGGGRLVLRTNAGPNNDLSCDWSYWTGLRFEP